MLNKYQSKLNGKWWVLRFIDISFLSFFVDAVLMTCIKFLIIMLPVYVHDHKKMIKKGDQRD